MVVGQRYFRYAASGPLWVRTSPAIGSTILMAPGLMIQRRPRKDPDLAEGDLAIDSREQPG